MHIQPRNPLLHKNTRLARGVLLSVVIGVACYNNGCKKERPGGSDSQIPSQKASGSLATEGRDARRHPERDRPQAGKNLTSYESIRSKLLGESAALTREDKAEISEFLISGPIEDCKKLIAEMPVNDTYDFFLTKFSRRFAEEDLSGAVAWLKSIPEEANLQTAYSVVGSAAAQNSTLAEQFAKNIKDPGLKDQFSSSYLRNLLNVENGAAKLREIINSEGKRAELGLDIPSVVIALGATKGTPENTAVILDSMKSLLENYTDLSGLSETSIADMVDPNQVQVAEFIDKNAGAKGVAEIFTRPLLESWARKDPISAANWLQNQQGALRDRGIVGFVSTIAKLQPASAMQWAISASDPAIRRQAVGVVAGNSFSEMEQKKTIINESNLSTAEKESYLKLLSH